MWSWQHWKLYSTLASGHVQWRNSCVYQRRFRASGERRQRSGRRCWRLHPDGQRRRAGRCPNGRLRRRRRAARRVAVILDYSDGMRSIRQLAARPATANDFTLFQLARRTLQLAWIRRVRIRHVRLICDRLIFPPAQLELFADEQEQTQKRNHLIIAIDSIRHRFGNEALQVGRTMAT